MLYSIFLLLYIEQTISVNIVLSFDDALAEHAQVATDLSTLGAKGVFYVNSGRIVLSQSSQSSQYMNLNQLQSIKALGHEIGGHTLTHANLSALTYSQQFAEICNDRDQLLSWGFDVTNFAYPFGNNNEDTFNIIGQCGYNSARDSGGIRSTTSCLSCPKSESQVPGNPLQLRSISYRTTMGPSELIWYVTEADNDPLYATGTLIFVFHEYGNNYVGSSVTSYITPAQLAQFVIWLQQNNVPINTLNNIINNRVYPNFASMNSQNVQNPNLRNLSVGMTFDFATSDHYNVSTYLEQYDMRGTFFVNAPNIGLSGYLNKQTLKKMQRNGHEIGSATLNNVRLSTLSLTDQQYQIKANRDLLIAQGFVPPTSFMWPFGDEISALFDTLKQYGFARARDIGGMKGLTSCLLCPSALELPFVQSSQKFAIRSINVNSQVKLGNLIWQIWQAENWMLANPTKNAIIVFKWETVCQGCQFSPDTFNQFLRWLYPRKQIGTINDKITIV